MRPRRLTLVVTVLSVALSGCNRAADRDGGDAIASCKQREAVEYPKIEAAAKDVLEDVSYSLQRVSTCEDAGYPGAAVYAEVKVWSNRRVAHRYLERHGWVKDGQEGWLVSPDRAYRANNVITKEPGFGRRFVTVQFLTTASR